jgi:hypothetical protein
MGVASWMLDRVVKRTRRRIKFLPPGLKEDENTKVSHYHQSQKRLTTPGLVCCFQGRARGDNTRVIIWGDDFG